MCIYTFLSYTYTFFQKCVHTHLNKMCTYTLIMGRKEPTYNIRINITIDQETLKMLDSLCQKQNISRSALIRELIREKAKKEKEFADIKVKEALERLKELRGHFSGEYLKNFDKFEELVRKGNIEDMKKHIESLFSSLILLDPRYKTQREKYETRKERMDMLELVELFGVLMNHLRYERKEKVKR